MIKKETIDKIFDVARVEEVIGDFVNLKRSGSNLKGYSPFNDEKTPSFMVSPSKQIWKDFSSGKGGNVVSFLMEHEHFNYPEALRWLAKKYNIEIDETEVSEEELQKRSDRESMLLVLDFAKDWFKQQLFETEMGKSVGLNYFKQRNFKEKTLKTFETGFSPDQKNAFTKAALKKGYKLEFLEKTGLTIVRNNRQIDRFRGRIIFPIHSLSGKILGFGGRILNTQLKTAKYVNSPESDVYHKSKVLYGIYQAKQQIIKDDQCILVEGYTDVLAFHQAGIHNVVASSGTALTIEQIQLIKRLSKNVLVIFDGDRAGISAALRGVDMILEQGLNVKILLLPDGEDPDSFSKKNTAEDLILFIEERQQDFINFKASLLSENAKNDPVKRGQVIREIVRSVAKIPDSIQQEIYIKEVAKIMDISEAVLFKELAVIKTGIVRKQHKDYLRQQRQNSLKPVEKETTQKTNIVDKRFILEKEIIKLLLLHGDMEVVVDDWDLKEIPEDNSEPILEKTSRKTSIAEEVYKQLQEDELEFSHQIFSVVYKDLIGKLLNKEKIVVADYITQIDEESSRLISDILMEDEKYKLAKWEEYNVSVGSKNDNMGWHTMDVLLNLRRILIQNLINQEKEKISSNELNSSFYENIKDYLFLFKVISTKLYRFA